MERTAANTREKVITEVLKEDYIGKHKARVLELYIKEYDNLRRAGEQRVQHEQQVLLYAVTFTGGILALVGTFADPSKNLASLAITVLSWFVPFIYFALAFISLRHISEIVEIVYYVNVKLRKKIMQLLDNTPVLGWDIYLVKEQRTPSFLLWPLYAARGFLFIVPSILSTSYFSLYAIGDPIIIKIGTAIDIILIITTAVLYITAFFVWRRAVTYPKDELVL